MESFSEYTDKSIVKRYKPINSISCKEDAYFVGLLTADGEFTTTKKGLARLSISSTEEYILNSLKGLYCPDSNISHRKRTENSLEVYEWRIASKMVNSLQKFSIMCHKPTRLLCGIPDKYFKYYLQGVIDGDGHIAVRHRKDCRTPRLNMQICHTSEKLLMGIQNKVSDILGVPLNLRQYKNWYLLKIDNTTNAIKFFSWLYEDTSSIINLKKQKVFINYYNTYVGPA